MITIDGAGSSHKVIEHLTALNARDGFTLEYSVGFDLDARARDAITLMPEKGWQPALDHTGAPHEAARVAELTDCCANATAATNYTPGLRECGSWSGESPSPRARNSSLFEQLAGYRHQLIATNTVGGQPQKLEARHRVHARVEGFIRRAKDTGLAKWPSNSWSINTAWVSAVAIASDLLCWTRLLLLDGHLADAEPQTLRYRLLHTAARIIKRSRKTVLRIPETWPWAKQLADAFKRVIVIPWP
jgi:hypothetical protein